MQPILLTLLPVTVPVVRQKPIIDVVKLIAIKGAARKTASDIHLLNAIMVRNANSVNAIDRAPSMLEVAVEGLVDLGSYGRTGGLSFSVSSLSDSAILRG